MKKKIYIAKKWRKDNFEEFINFLLNEKFFPTTYEDIKCRKVGCVAGKSRSVSDISILVRTYFPTVTEHRIINSIYYCLLYSNSKKKHLLYCDNIKKLTVYKEQLTYGNRKFKVFYDYQKFVKKDNLKLKDHITFKYFFKKIGFTDKQIEKEINS